MLKQQVEFDMMDNDATLPHRHEEKIDDDLMENLREEMRFLDDSAEKEQRTVLKVATGKQWRQLRKGGKPGAELNETDFTHIDPLSNFWQMPTAKENKEAPIYDMRQQLQRAIANANKDRSLYAGRVDKNTPMSYSRKIDWYEKQSARLSKAEPVPWEKINVDSWAK